MKKSAFIVTWRRALSAVVLVIVGFVAKPIEAMPPSKPRTIPNSAFWVGGVDGGVWISLGKRQKERFFATVYFETGKPWARGWFVASQKSHSRENGTALAKQIDSFDGERIFLKDQKTVYCLDKTTP